MDEQKLKDIKAPEKINGITDKRRQINTYIFTGVSSICNLFFMVALVFLFIVLFTKIFGYFNSTSTQDEFAKYTNTIMWLGVISGISLSLFLQKFIIRTVIKVFKLQDKFEKNFVEKYCGPKKD